MVFSADEIRDVIIAIIVMTAIFSYPNFITDLAATFIIVFVSLMLRVLMTKFWAYRYGVKAFFVLWPFGTILGLIFMFLQPLKIASMGSMQIFPHKFGRWKRRYRPWSRFTDITYREIGIISAVSPLMNVLLGLFAWFMTSSVFVGDTFFSFMAMINGWMALVALFPIRPLDGVRVFTWKPWFWFLMIVVSVILLFNTVPVFFG